jgi:hypothetical protein
MPRVTRASNPLQYVVSLNPPLILANYSMMPLCLTEIDYDRDGREVIRKEHSKIAASRTANVTQLNLSEGNKSKFLLQFTDVDSGMRLTQIVDNFHKQTIENGLFFHRHHNDQEVDVDSLSHLKEQVYMKVEKTQVVYQDLKVY